MLRFPTILIVPILLAGASMLRAQTPELGAAVIRPGWSSDTVLRLFRAEYRAIDTLTLSRSIRQRSIRLAPVTLAGMQGLLVLDVDSNGTILKWGWSRQPASGYQRQGVWKTFTGWNDWTVPDRAETMGVAYLLTLLLGPADAIADRGGEDVVGLVWMNSDVRTVLIRDSSILAVRTQP